MNSVYKFEQSFLDSLKAQKFDELDDDAPDLQSAYEVDDALSLILLGVVSPDVFNTRDWVTECRERLKDPERTPTIMRSLVNEMSLAGIELPDLPYEDEENRRLMHRGAEGLAYLEHQWAEHNKKFAQFSPELRPLLASRQGITTAECFVDMVQSGMTPPPEILLSVANCISLYLRAAGAISLEHAFFGKEQKGAGNYAARANKGTLFRVFDEIVKETRARQSALEGLGVIIERESIEQIATQYLNDRVAITEEDFPDIAAQYEDVQSFLRGYNRWRKKHAEASDN